ncbi:helix-turn-helix domain-containing protein [Lentzea sp. BCCO 10_0856]|uniref:Helix-turn-helix domain-containing protein n=1 Tax=Lentzea miocenica TaxID=3095431 RepID=A0ABU4SY81_9PSEU|nr:helix-turn-helix domain-containing protein [Lentzea sp. BCCO 10_0856]MDX8030732.1 helix-turn-helix domain-containing protein [Lentzea sp. BCCO 10_0856]
MREFGELLRTHRIHAGLTQQQLADFAMVSVRAIRDLECGRTRSPRAETVRLLADGLRLDEGSRANLQQAGGRPAGPVPVAPPAPAAVIVGREVETLALMDLLAEGAAAARGRQGGAAVLTHGHGAVAAAQAGERQAEAADVWAMGGGVNGRETEGATSARGLQRGAADLLAAGTTDGACAGGPGAARRLVTITGVSGVGKTRLALEVAGELHFRLGWSVLWHPARTPVIDDDQDTVLVTDRLPDLCLLAAHPRLRIVVTALAPTGLPGEHVFPLAPLGDDAAVRLLLTHVHRVRPGFRAEPGNQAALTGLVHELDGLPSALEFAAGWFMVYSPQHLLERLRSNPMDPTSAHLRDSLRRSLSTLDSDELALLTRMADGSGWDRPDAPGTGHDPARALCVRGLVRRAGPRYEVLNLVRAAVLEPVSGPHLTGGVALAWP